MSKKVSLLLTLTFWAVCALYGYFRVTGCPANASPEACAVGQARLMNLYYIGTGGLLIVLLGIWWTGARKK